MQFSIVLLILVFSLLVYANDFDPDTVRLLACKYASKTEPNKVNCAFRSNIPITDNQFDYSQVTSSLKSVAEHSGVILPDGDLYIIDISLLEPQDSNLAIERTYFAKNPDHGILINYPLYGATEDPSTYSQEDIVSMSATLNWMRDDVEALMDTIDHYLSDFSSDRNLNIIVHCQHGYD
jgi:hypothetical protein